MDTNNEILDAIEILADKKIGENITKVLTGICTSVNINKNTCVMDSNGVSGTVYFYGNPPEVNGLYRIFVPSNDMSRAFVIVPPRFTVNPNLLDNWYFEKPVNQRGGKIIQSGVNIYTDSALKTLIGPAAYACPVVELTSTYAKVQDAKNTGSYYYAAPADVVRGYTSNGCAVDRWMLYTDGGNVAISNGYLDIYASKQYGTYLTQKIGPELAKALAGKTVTWSVLAVDGDIAFSANINKDDSYVDSFVIEPNTISFKTFTFPTDFTDISFVFAGNVAGHVRPIAAKLELGPTQTLAHQENGQWVLNEVPNYGGQLRRCQRYYYQVHYNQYETIGFAYDGPEYAFIIIPLPTEMRGATPTLKIIGDIIIGGKVRTLTGCSCHGCEAIIGVNYTAQPSSAGATYAYSPSAGGVTISIIYDL